MDAVRCRLNFLVRMRKLRARESQLQVINLSAELLDHLIVLVQDVFLCDVVPGTARARVVVAATPGAIGLDGLELFVFAQESNVWTKFGGLGPLHRRGLHFLFFLR